ncbi:RnfABCDGE type electron transport complex subunit D [Clostridium sp.]|uniref:RnfABCDGE type electron transport complex subunit D n=1 Tax=Clostridium sp. TaxID=1506 RepID=UPI003217D72A
MSGNLFNVSVSPHIKSKETVSTVMRDVLIALVPATIAGVYFFGLGAALVMLTAVVSAMLSEFIFNKITKKPNTLKDLSAVITGLLLAFNLPPTLPLWMVAVGSAFSIIVVKCFFGGLGQNIMNPALAGRAFLLAAYPSQMTHWTLDGVSKATPLAILRNGGALLPDTMDAFLGSNIAGCIGEVSALALLIGGAYLLYRKVITWHIPATYLGTVFIITTVLGRDGFMTGRGLYELFIGGVMIGALFMATDYTTSPMTKKGQIIFGVGCGVITTIIRLYGGYAEGVSYSILLMNLLVPMIDKWTTPRVFGGAK